MLALLIPSCQQVWNKLLTTDIIRLVARLFQQVRYGDDIRILLPPCVIILTNPSELTIYRCKIPTVITETLIVLGKLGNLLRKHCFLSMFRHVSQSGQTLGNISEKQRETSNVSEFARKHFCFSGSKFCFRDNVSTGGQTGKHLRKHRESQMFPQQCFLVCPGL